MYKLSKDYDELYNLVKRGVEVIAFAEGELAMVKLQDYSIYCGRKGYQVFKVSSEFIASVGVGTEREWFKLECKDCGLEWVRPYIN